MLDVTDTEQTVIVHWVEAPPAAAVEQRNAAHFRDPMALRHYVFWRGRWCVVSEEALDLFERLDEWLRDPSHGMLWEPQS